MVILMLSGDDGDSILLLCACRLYTGSLSSFYELLNLGWLPGVNSSADRKPNPCMKVQALWTV